MKRNMNDKYHYKDGKILYYWDENRIVHREDGPAIEKANGDREWCLNDQTHRVDGPAMEYADGDKNWYLEDIIYTEKEFNKIIKEIKEMPLELRLTDPREWVRKLKDDN